MPINHENNMKLNHDDNAQIQKIDRKPYHKPVLEKLGDLRSLTLGPSLGFPEDSGSGWPEDTWT
jgi:hypothetical protein